MKFELWLGHGKIQTIDDGLARTGEELENHGSADTELKYFEQASNPLEFSVDAMLLARHTNRAVEL